jgi:hypothetical protein
MKVGSVRLTPATHRLLAFVLTFWLGASFMSMAMPRANLLRGNGHESAAVFVSSLPVVVWVSAALLFFPLRNSASHLQPVRFIGRLPWLTRLAIAIAVALLASVLVAIVS